MVGPPFFVPIATPADNSFHSLSPTLPLPVGPFPHHIKPY